MDEDLAAFQALLVEQTGARPIAAEAMAAAIRLIADGLEIPTVDVDQQRMLEYFYPAGHTSPPFPSALVSRAWTAVAQWQRYCDAQRTMRSQHQAAESESDDTEMGAV